MGSLSRKLLTTLLAGAALTLLTGAFGAGGAAASTKVKGKVHACVIKKGEDKGLMRFAPKGKCKRGEKKLTWNKRGKRGPAGANGGAGGGAQTGELEATVAALCSQVTAVTSQLNSFETVLSGLGLSGLIPPGLGLTVPELPAPLAPFSCP